MNVYTYFEPISELPNSLDMLKTWKYSWLRNGFIPVVLDWDYVYWKWEWYLDKVSCLPTTNPKAYELACFKRWAVMAEIGEGLLIDYDVVNIWLTPDYFEDKGYKNICLDPNGNPGGGVYSNDRNFWIDITQYFQRYKPEPKETIVSDMTIFSKIKGGYRIDPLCFEYGTYERNDPRVACVHCCYSSTTQKGLNRMEVIRSLL